MTKLWLFTLILSVTAVAQSPNISVHTHNNPDLIDGSKTPDAIPDSTAWRLWLLSVTAKDPKHPEFDQMRQDAYLITAGYDEDDLPILRQVLDDFRMAYDSMMQAHNLADATGQNPSPAALKVRRDSLVAEARASLLSGKPETAERVKKFINGEKKRDEGFQNGGTAMTKCTLLLLLLFAPFAAGQMTAGYSSYANYGGDGDGGHLWVTAVVDGSGHTCSCPAVHTGTVQVTLNGVKTKTVGPAQPPTSYMTVSNTNTMSGAVAGQDYEVDTSAQVTCTFAGVFFQENPGGLLGTIGYRLSAYVYSGSPSPGQCLWMATCTGSICRVTQFTDSCTPDPFNIYRQCYDIVFKCRCGGTECLLPHAYCRKKNSPGTCT